MRLRKFLDTVGDAEKNGFFLYFKLKTANSSNQFPSLKRPDRSDANSGKRFKCSIDSRVDIFPIRIAEGL